MPNDADGVFDVIATENHEAPAPVVPETKTETEAEPVVEKPADTQETETKTNPVETEEAEEETPTEPVTDTTEPSKTETKTEVPEDVDWKKFLPPPPVLTPVIEPVLNEEGDITNMTPQQYEDYIVSKAENRIAERNYVQQVENAALDAAEKILPEIKTDQNIRNILESMRIASVVNGQQIDVVEAATQVRAMLGGAKAEGANNAKTHITVQKNAQVETQGGTQTQSDDGANKDLDKRLRQGDDTAFEQLFSSWAEEGKL